MTSVSLDQIVSTKLSYRLSEFIIILKKKKGKTFPDEMPDKRIRKVLRCKLTTTLCCDMSNNQTVKDLYSTTSLIYFTLQEIQVSSQGLDLKSKSCENIFTQLIYSLNLRLQWKRYDHP